jgi:hypothetical protein
MVELRDETLVFSFPEVHQHAVLHVDFQRTLRIPDDGRDYPLPPGLGRFPLRLVDECKGRVPERWREHGGVLLPMHQAEAMWLHLSSPFGYPIALKLAAGKINAVTGEAWNEPLHRAPQDYVVVPEQPWLDGFCVAKGLIRQFVAMPLGSGYSAEEQLTGQAEHGGLQLLAVPLRLEHYVPQPLLTSVLSGEVELCCDEADDVDMGLAPGGRMRQEIYEDPHPFEHWDTRRQSRCFVHLTNTPAWRALTGEAPPTLPPTAAQYTAAGLPWFEWYGGDAVALEGAEALAGLESAASMGVKKGEEPLPENESVEPGVVVPLGKPGTGRVREGSF